MITTDTLWIFNGQQITRRTMLDLAELPSSRTEMPSSVSGRVFLTDGDQMIVELSKKKSVILNQTQLEYKVTEFDAKTGNFSANRAGS